MSKVRVHNFSISLDGFATGEGLTFEAPFGHAGERLHEWMFATRFWRELVGEDGGSSGLDNAFAERNLPGIGAEIMGRGKFGPQTGPWDGVGSDDEWRGWWGPNPPFHSPVFVLTHHTRPSIEMEGGTVFHFVDAPPKEALALAKEAAGDLDVRIGGGPATVGAFLAEGLIDVLPRRAGAAPPRPRRPPVGRPGGPRPALRRGGRAVAERRRAPHAHPPGHLSASRTASTTSGCRSRMRTVTVSRPGR